MEDIIIYMLQKGYSHLIWSCQLVDTDYLTVRPQYVKLDIFCDVRFGSCYTLDFHYTTSGVAT